MYMYVCTTNFSLCNANLRSHLDSFHPSLQVILRVCAEEVSPSVITFKAEHEGVGSRVMLDPVRVTPLQHYHTKWLCILQTQVTVK